MKGSRIRVGGYFVCPVWWTLSAFGQAAAPVIPPLQPHEAAAAVTDTANPQASKKVVIVVTDVDREMWLRGAVKGTGVSLVPVRAPAQLAQAVLDADALVGPCNVKAIESGTKLRWVQAGNVGVDQCLKAPSIRDGRIALTSTRGANSGTVAEHAMAMLLALSRKLPSTLESQRAGAWQPRAPTMMSLEGKTLLIVGLGSVGTEIAHRASAFKMRVLATRKKQGNRPPFVEFVGAADELQGLIGQADVVINATPLTKETYKLFDAKLFALMRPSALFINIGRGASVATDDLVAALIAGKLGGAGLDVADPEPLPRGHPLWGLENVIITPHLADRSELKEERVWQLIRENLRRFAQGDELLSIVDPRQGY